jgi:hypothetical protein
MRDLQIPNAREVLPVGIPALRKLEGVRVGEPKGKR